MTLRTATRRAFLYPAATAAATSTVLFSDAFTGSGSLSSHTPDIDSFGSGWSADAAWTINGAASTTDPTKVAVVETSITDYTVSAILTVVNPSSSLIRGIVVRRDDVSLAGYIAGVRHTANQFGIAAFTDYTLSGDAWLDSASVTLSAGTPYTIEISCVGTTITATLNGANTVQITDATVTDRTLVGMSLRYAGDNVDDFVVLG